MLSNCGNGRNGRITAEEGLRGQNVLFIHHILCDLFTRSPYSAAMAFLCQIEMCCCIICCD